MSCPKCGRSPTPECQAPSSPSAHFILVRGAQLIPGFRIIFSIPAARGDGAISTCKEGGGDRNPPPPPILPPLMPTALGLCRNNPRCQRSCTPQFCWDWQVGGVLARSLQAPWSQGQAGSLWGCSQSTPAQACATAMA